jgi:hypothetical protein
VCRELSHNFVRLDAFEQRLDALDDVVGLVFEEDLFYSQLLAPIGVAKDKNTWEKGRGREG